MAQAAHDQNNPVAAIDGYWHLTSEREGFESMQGYEAHFTLNPQYPLASNYLAFDQRMGAAPYVLNMLRGVNAEGNFAMAVAARPADRQSDSFDLMANGAAVGNSAYTPWVTSQFRLPELETTLNIASRSTYDGIPFDHTTVGGLGLLDDEIVQIVAVDLQAGQITIKRGCLDTIPAVHIAGTRMWLLNRSALDTSVRANGVTVDYRARPGVYGDPVDVATLPSHPVTLAVRAKLPYPPGRLVVNGRPWFEEARAENGKSVAFSWARRNLSLIHI